MTGVLDRLGEEPQRALLVGMGVANRATAGALVRRNHEVVAVDDRPDDALREAAGDLGVQLEEAPGRERLAALVTGSDLVVPSPGLPESHPVFEVARAHDRPVVGELDLAAVWDERPVVAVTGTNGKTTVVELSADALTRSGMTAVAAGNTDLPMVAAIDDPSADVFVVEASSFRLAPTTRFAPRVGTWLNFSPDHLDVHSDLASYERAKARIWAGLPEDGLAVANAGDPIVMAHVRADRRVETFGRADADWRVADEKLMGPHGPVMAVEQLWRDLPHDIEDALAAAATAGPVGATPEAIAAACHEFSGLAHRVSVVGEIAGSIFYDDSKATTPHATLAALRGFGRVVLIAGGRNKGVALDPLGAGVDHIAAVVAIGEATDELIELFGSTRPVVPAGDMDQAVAAASRLAVGGIPVLLSPGCASFDWYGGYGERGDDFVRAVRDLGRVS